jgi:hypothetical protein
MTFKDLLGINFNTVSDFFSDCITILSKPSLIFKPIQKTDLQDTKLKFNPELIKFSALCIFIGTLLIVLLPNKEVLAGGESKVYDIILPIFYCLIMWMIWSTILHLVTKIFFRKALFYYTCSASIQVFAISFLVCNVIVLLLSPLSDFISNDYFDLETLGIYALYFPLQLIFTSVFLPLVIFELYKIKYAFKKSLLIILVSSINLLFVILNLILWMVNGRIVGFG